MRTLSGLLVDYFDHTKDDTAANQARGIRRMNSRQRMILNNEQYFFRKKEAVILSVANQQNYKLPIDYKKMYSVKIKVGEVNYVLQYIPGIAQFDRLNSQPTTTSSNISRFFTIREGELIIWPNPSEDDLEITIAYERRFDDMSLLDYTAGNIAVNTGDTIVIGTTTAWDFTVKPGVTQILINDIPYVIASLTDTTHLVLDKPYEGPNISGSSYIVADCPLLPEEYSDILWISAAMDYYTKKESQTFQYYQGQFFDYEARLKIYGRTEANNNVTYVRPYRLYNYNFYPTRIG